MSTIISKCSRLKYHVNKHHKK
ncbi:hypothetical protein Ocin01_19132 [Orchesella cincta]|uniref:Uncharacterized protein n=1 Tax=Orchesella cincta TaxID=48709 RepID=A0A1D2M3K9_ORCCI|nr:hypothetical protein Ocin01_19132 [Orchesella cincta]